jgi:hypothetical protein
MKTALLFMMLAVSVAQLLAGDTKPDPVTIKLFTDENSNEEGLGILLKQKDYPGVKTERIEFEIRIVNRLLEEVFVEVTDLGDAHMCLDGGLMGWSGIGFPDNIPLLKRLHAATIYGKEKVTCACGSVVVKQSCEMDLSKFVGRSGTFRFQVKGFYRTNGKEFCETIDLKFNIIDPRKSEHAVGGIGG